VLLTFLSRGDVVGEIALLDSLPPFGGGDGHAGLRTLPPLSVQV
jgi:CRP-like cAMP-binding protein